MRLNEIAASAPGGNVFKDADGNSLTRRVSRQEAQATIEWLESLTRLPLIDNVLGSVGKKDSSKDIDLGVDERTISKDELISILSKWTNQQEGSQKDWIKKSGISVHFKSPIGGNPKHGFVQTDFMFDDDIRFMKFGLFSAGDQSRFSGADRNLIMSSIAKSLPDDLKYSWQKGLIIRSTGDQISKDPDKIAVVLLDNGHQGKDFNSVESIASAIRKDQRRIDALKNLIIRLRSSNGKKPGEIKADAEEADRINNFLALIRS